MNKETCQYFYRRVSATTLLKSGAYNVPSSLCDLFVILLSLAFVPHRKSLLL